VRRALKVFAGAIQTFAFHGMQRLYNASTNCLDLNKSLLNRWLTINNR